MRFVLDAVADYLPSPLDIALPKAVDPETEEEIKLTPDENGPLCAYAYKIMTDPFVGTLTFTRVYSGKIEDGNEVYNSIKKTKEKIARIFRMHANKKERISAAPFSVSSMIIFSCCVWISFIVMKASMGPIMINDPAITQGDILSRL